MGILSAYWVVIYSNFSWIFKVRIRWAVIEDIEVRENLIICTFSNTKSMILKNYKQSKQIDTLSVTEIRELRVELRKKDSQWEVRKKDKLYAKIDFGSII